MEASTNKPNNKPVYANWWFWVILVVLFLGVIGIVGKSDAPEDSSKAEENSASQSVGDEDLKYGKKYILSGEILGEYGRAVILNKDTDMPVTKNLYKIPAGKYRITTTNKKMSAFSIVKDEIGIEEGNAEYPEILQYVNKSQYLITAGNNDFNGHAEKSYIITLAEDESIQLPSETDSIIAEEIVE